MACELQIAHTRLPRSHHRHFSTCLTVSPRLISWHRGIPCRVFLSRMWRLAWLRRLLQIACQPGAF